MAYGTRIEQMKRMSWYFKIIHIAQERAACADLLSVRIRKIRLIRVLIFVFSHIG
jgi:hypothetical protein